jgi:hypothetical protein
VYKRRYSSWKNWNLILIFLLLTVSACDNNGVTSTPGIGTDVFGIYFMKDIDEAIDVIFVPDDDYGDMSVTSNKETFLNDVDELINQGFWQNNVLSVNSDLFNFWYMTRSGNAQESTGTCPTVSWPNWTGAHFAEVKILVHPNDLRDCAWRTVGLSTTEPGSFRTVVHEFSHAAFHLPDEYCCDGGYWNKPPILYDSGTVCENDPDNEAWRDCQSFTDVKGKVWWRSEDSIVDIMSSNYSTVWEYGPADWVVVRDVLEALPNAVVYEPDVFAPDPWPTP